MMIEDEVLKWRFKRGSREALSRIYEKYVHLLLSIAMGLLNDPHEAEDVVQDVFVSFAKGVGDFRLRGSLKAYLATSVVNRVRDQVRRERVRQGRQDGSSATLLNLCEPDERLVYDERCRRLVEALAQLPHEQREAVVLKTKDGMKLKDIARLQGVTPAFRTSSSGTLDLKRTCSYPSGHGRKSGVSGLKFQEPGMVHSASHFTLQTSNFKR